MREELNEVKKFFATICKTTFLWLSLIIIILEVIYIVDGENLLHVNNSMQFLGVYIFELIPLAYYMQIKKIERKLSAKSKEKSR